MTEVSYFTVQELGGKHNSIEHIRDRIQGLLPEGETIETEGSVYLTLIVELPKDMQRGDMETLLRRVRRFSRGYHIYAKLPEAEIAKPRPVPVLDDSNRHWLDEELKVLSIHGRFIRAVAMNLYAMRCGWVSAYHYRGKIRWPVYIGELVQLERSKVQAFRELGPLGMAALEPALAELNLGLGMDLGDWSKPKLPEPEELPEPSTELLDTRVLDMDFSQRVKAVFSGGSPEYLGELVRLHGSELLNDYHGFGEACLKEVRAKLSEKNLRLGMKPAWVHPRRRKAA